MILHYLLLLLYVAERCKPAALYSGATIVILSGAQAVRVLTRTSSASPTS